MPFHQKAFRKVKKTVKKVAKKLNPFGKVAKAIRGGKKVRARRPLRAKKVRARRRPSRSRRA